MVKINRTHDGYILTFIRRTTEEENNVLECKRLNKEYIPKNYQLTSVYLDGQTKPFTLRYDSLEERYGFVIRAR